MMKPIAIGMWLTLLVGLWIVMLWSVFFALGDPPPDKKVEIATNWTSSVPPIETYMPKFRVITNDAGFQVAFMSFDSTNWTVQTNIFGTISAAERVIGECKRELRFKYDILKGIADAFDPRRPK